MLIRVYAVLFVCVVAHGQEAQSAATLNEEAMLLHDRRQLADAERLYRRAIGIWLENEAKSPGLLRCIANLGALYIDSRQFGKAEAYITAMLDRFQDRDGSDPDFARLLQVLATAWYGQKRYREAEPIYRRLLAAAEGGSDVAPADLASILNNLGSVCTETGRLDEAQAYLERARQLVDADDPLARASVLSNLATAKALAKRNAESEALFGEALRITEAAHGTDHPLIGYVLSNWAAALRKSGRKREAKPLEKRAKSIRARAEDPVRRRIDMRDLRVADALR